MEGSILNSRHETFSRLEGLQSAVDTLLDEVGRLTGMAGLADGVDARIFAYAFGLKTSAATVDLFRLLEATRQIETMKQDYEKRLHQDPREVALSLLGSQAMSLLSMSRQEAEQVLRTEIERAIVDKVIAQAAKGTLTLSLRELVARWRSMRAGLGGSTRVLGGGTPMCQCLKLVGERFGKERVAGSGGRSVLFIVSDGESSDGDPRPAASMIKKQGVQIVACFVTSADVTAAKQLYRRPAEQWSAGARAMFDIASRVPEQSDEVEHLRKSGWMIEPDENPVMRWIKSLAGKQTADDSRQAVSLFAQVNHSEHLDDFIKVVLTPLRIEQGMYVSGSSHRDR